MGGGVLGVGIVLSGAGKMDDGVRKRGNVRNPEWTERWAWRSLASGMSE
jgi:hypothetical protein